MGIKWYSFEAKDEVQLEMEPSLVKSVAKANGLDPELKELVETFRAESLHVEPVIALYTYGTLMEGERNYELMARYAKPEHKQLRGVFKGFTIYEDPHLPYPLGVLDEEGSTYMERYLISVSDLEYFDRYEGAPDLYRLEKFRDGYVYVWNNPLTEKQHPVSSDKLDADWRGRR